MEGIAEQAKLNKLGVNYLQQKQIDIAQTAAGNEGAGNFMGIGMGLEWVTLSVVWSVMLSGKVG